MLLIRSKKIRPAQHKYSGCNETKTGEKCHQLCYLIWKFNEQEKKLNLGPDAALDEYWIATRSATL